MPAAPTDGEPVYLDLTDALELYAAIIDRTTAQAAAHLRDQAALEGALSRPLAYAQYEDANVFLQAAVLAHGIAETQPFVDGNKRLALVAMLTFLELADYRVDASDADLAAWIVSLSARTAPAALAEHLRRTARRRTHGL